MTDRDRQRWAERYATDLRLSRAPSAWVVDHCLALPPDAVVVDLAAGSGRHARALAERGRRVVAVDFVERAVRAACATPGVWGVVADAAGLPFADGSLDAILVVNFLDRALVPTFARLLRPRGVLVAETYTLGHRALVDAGRSRAPTNPAYMLAPGELPRLVAPLEVVAAREGLVRDAAGERYVASVVARKTGAG